MSGKTTRVSTRNKGASKFAGLPSPLDKTDPPTYQQIIQYSYFLMNTYPHLSGFGISKLIAKEVIDIWKAVNPRLPLINEISIIRKVNILCFQKTKQINRRRLPASQNRFWKTKLNSLFDISSCSCKLPILSCDNSNVKCNKENCQTKHIICTCPMKQKVPMEDREYLKDQRSKIGPKGTFQLGPIDKTAIKKGKKGKSQQKNLKMSSPIASTSCVQDDVSEHSSTSIEETEDYKQPDSLPKGPYNLTKIPRYSLELVRGGISSNLGASLANALLLDLSAMGLLIPNIDIKNIYMDKCKINRAKAKIKRNVVEKQKENVGNLLCIGVDGRTDKDTLIYKELVEENGIKTLRKAKGPERHLTITKETPKESEYLTHRVIPDIGATGTVLADQVADVLENFKSLSSIKAVLVDNTNVNTGCEGGLVTLLEKKINRNLHTIGCSLHQNELPLRALFKHVDGTTKSPTTFNGPLGKLCAKDCHTLPQISFSTVGNLLQFNLEIEDIDGLSSDQRLLYEYTVGISRGKVDPKFASWKIGPLNQARWLTLAIRLMCLWTRGAYPQNLSNKLYSLINFIVNVYAVCWFYIKKSNRFHYQPMYIYEMIDRIRKQPIDIQRIAFKNIQYNAFALLPENFLFSMVKCDEPEVREEGIQRILAIRKGKPATKRL